MQARESLAELLSRVVAARDAALPNAGRKGAALPEDRARPAARPSSTTSPPRCWTRRSKASSSPTRRISRPGLKSPRACRRNRRPLGQAAVRALDDRAGEDAQAARPEVAIIGVGGVDSAEAALEKIRAGADLVQLYTGMIYGGPALPGRIVRGLVAVPRQEGLKLDRRPARQPARALGAASTLLERRPQLQPQRSRAG